MAKITRVDPYRRKGKTGKVEKVSAYLRKVHDDIAGLEAKQGINTTVTKATPPPEPDTPAKKALARAALFSKLNPKSTVDDVVYDFMAKAAEAEPEISAILNKVTRAHGGRISGFGHRLKDRDSLTAKISKGHADTGFDPATWAKSEVVDALRYTVVSDPDDNINLAKRLIAGLESEGNTVDAEDVYNYWGEESAYHGINIAVTAPNGLRWELQIHTEDSLVRKRHSHHWYKILGNPALKRQHDQARINTVAAWQGLERPKGWNEFGHLRSGSEAPDFVGGEPSDIPESALAPPRGDEDPLDLSNLTPILRLTALVERSGIRA